MNGWPPTRGLWRAAALLCVLALGCASAAGLTVAQKKARARTQLESAERQREALNGLPIKERSRREYQKVADAYRQVYYISPNLNQADAAVVAVAELLAEMGRAFDDDKCFHDAIAQYQFLQREYPGSKYRVDALFTIAQIYDEDLNDPTQARAGFVEFLERYPHHRLAAEAQKAIQRIDAEAAAAKSRKGKAPLEAKESRPEVRKPPSRLLVTGVRHWSTPDYTRVAIDLEDEVQYEAGRIASPDRIFFDLHGTKLAPTLVGKTFDVDDGFLRKIRVAQYQADMTRVVLEVDDVSDYSAFLLPNPERLIIDIHGRQPSRATLARMTPTPPARPEASAAKTPPHTPPPTPAPAPSSAASAPVKPGGSTAKPAEKSAEKSSKPAPVESAEAREPEVKATNQPTTKPTYQAVPPHEAKPASDGERSLIRALGLKIGRIVLDAGHGGHDTGTIGPSGLEEKDLVLDVTLRLGKLLEQRMGAEVTYTRDDDTFVPLETRTALANQAQADLFLSIHANSSHDPAARGIETYYLNFTSSRDALEVAARENAVSDKSVHELQDLVKKIALKEKIEESREFASDVQWGMHTGMSAKGSSVRDRGVKKAPFVVLIGANMPSILAEIAFVSNPGDEKKLKTPEYRQKIAEALYRGVVRYASGLSGVKVASKTPKANGQ